MLQRKYIPGDRWLYYKFYCGPKTADDLLTDVILPVVSYLKEKQLIAGWFFIRYSDPDLHLRIRFQFNDVLAVGEIMQAVNKYIKPLVEHDMVWKVMCDTYQQEMERYHPDAIELGEKLFQADSELTTNFINLIDGDEGENLRWMFSFLSIDYMLSDFGFSDEGKLNLLEKIKDGFAQEFNMNKMLKHQLDKKFRLHRDDINLIMNLNEESAAELAPLLELLSKRTLSNKIVVEQLKILEQKEDSVNIVELMPSYIHMLMNRLFRSKQRAHELVVYDLLWRYYRSKLAKEKYSKYNKEKVLKTFAS
jgi:thiopeptide-type bacteriocin biosynthesis protein